MNQGVEILLARMDSNPDEFTTVRGKWDWVMEGVNRRIAGKDKDVLAYLTDEEAQALYDKMQLLARDGFTRNVMETLLREEEEANPFADAVVRGMGQLSQYQIKPNAIIAPAKLKADMLKLLEETAPDLDVEAQNQILADLQALEASKKRRKK